MLFREIMAFRYEKYMQHENSEYRQNAVSFFTLKQVVDIVTILV
jgi:hypothetical protein